MRLQNSEPLKSMEIFYSSVCVLFCEYEFLFFSFIAAFIVISTQ